MSNNLYSYVLDCSVTMAWCFEDESNSYSDLALDNLQNGTVIVPTIWPLEVANVLLLSTKKKRMTEMQAANFIDVISTLPIIVDLTTSSKAMRSIFSLAKQENLTIYDSAYLELALREKIPLITLDKELIKAAKRLNIAHELPKK